MIRAHGIDAMMYADNFHLYIIIKRGNRRVTLDQLELCIDDVLCWNTQNGFKCNPTRLKSFTSTLAIRPVIVSHTSESALLLSNQ